MALYRTSVVSVTSSKETEETGRLLMQPLLLLHSSSAATAASLPSMERRTAAAVLSVEAAPAAELHGVVLSAVVSRCLRRPHKRSTSKCAWPAPTSTTCRCSAPAPPRPIVTVAPFVAAVFNVPAATLAVDFSCISTPAAAATGLCPPIAAGGERMSSGEAVKTSAVRTAKGGTNICTGLSD